MRLVSRLNQFAVCLTIAVSCFGIARADELQVLSAGAIEPGLKAVASAFGKQTGHVRKNHVQHRA